MARSAATVLVRKFDHALAWFENLLLVVAAISVLVMMFVTGATC